MKHKKSITYVEVLIAFSIFLLGFSLIIYFFSPYFKPQYKTALDVIEKNFENNFALNAALIGVVVNDTGCIKFEKYDASMLNNSLFFYRNWTKISFTLQKNNIILNTAKKEFFLINSTKEISRFYSVQQPCQNPIEAKVYYSFPIQEKFLGNLSQLTANMDYGAIKNKLIPSFNLEFNISVYDMHGNLVDSIGRPFPKTNVFAKEKIYKEIGINGINFVIVRFYVW